MGVIVAEHLFNCFSL